MTLDGAILFTLVVLFFTWGSWYVVKWGYFLAARFSMYVERKVTPSAEVQEEEVQDRS